MRKQRTHFDKAFKENAVKLSLERKNISGLAQELGITPFFYIVSGKNSSSKRKPVSPDKESSH